MKEQLKLLQLPGLFAFLLSVISSLLASYYYKSLDTNDHKVTAILTLSIISLTLLSFCILTVRILFIQSKSKQISAGMSVRNGTDKLDIGSFIQGTQNSFAFMGVIAKRSVASDQFKKFLEQKRDTPISIRFLLLDPRSPIFQQRARDENESSEVWTSDLKSTMEALRHYGSKYNVKVSIRLYSTYPIWRLMVKDNWSVVANMFLMVINVNYNSRSTTIIFPYC